MNVRLYLMQRASAAILAPLVIGHVVIILYASHRGLSAADVLFRTRGSIAWALYYGTFVIAAAIHAAIGVRTIISEWGPRKLARSTRALDAVMWLFGLLLVGLGLRAAFAVVAP